MAVYPPRGTPNWDDNLQVYIDAQDTAVADATAAAIPGQVASAVAADSTVKAAAAEAVDGALDQAGLFHGAFDVDALAEDNPAVTITDSEGRRSWLEAGQDGGPTGHAVDLLGEALPAVPNQVTALGKPYVITDEEDNEAFYIDSTGSVGFKPDAATLARILTAVGQIKVSGPDFYTPGDSLTAGAGGEGVSWPGVLQTLITQAGGTGTVRNGGVGGETSPTIAARTNATPLVMLVSGGQVPASGPVQVTLQAINGSVPGPLVQGNGGGSTGVLWTEAGPVTGNLTQASGVYSFTRTTNGSSMLCARPAAFRYDFGDARRGDIALIALGQNGPSDARAIEDAQAIIRELDAHEKRWLVLSRPSTTDNLDALYDSAFGHRHVAVRKYLVTYGLADAGITPTTQDNIDIANGVVPTSLRSDAIHGNAAYYTAVGTIVFRRIREMGWIA